MNYYVVSYDLIDEKDYPKIQNAINSVSYDWVRPLLSFFVIKTTWEREPIMRKLMTATDKDDKIFLVECDIDTWLSVNVSQQAVDRLHAWRM